MEFNSLAISTIILLLLSFINSINSQDLTNEQKECFVTLLVLHYPKGKLSMAGKKFVYPKTSLPRSEKMRKLLNDPQRLEELSKCLEGHIEWGWIWSKLSTIIHIYEEMLNIDDKVTFPILEKLQGQFHNVQCFMDLMVLEGRQKMGSPDFQIPPFDPSLITDLVEWRITVSEEGKIYLKRCIIKYERMAITLIERDVLNLHERNVDDFLVATVSRIPYSTKLLEEINKECHCLAKTMLKYYNASTNWVILHNIPLSMRTVPDQRSAVFRMIGKKMHDTEEKIYDKKHGKIFEEYEKCIYRKVPFLKSETNREHEHGNQYIDIGAIFSQGFIVVPNAVKRQLDKQSDCLMEFLYAKVGWKHFSKVVGFKNTDDMVNIAYKDYVFQQDDKRFLLKLDNSEEMFTRLQHGNLLKIIEGTEEFAELKKCGVNGLHDAQQGKEIFYMDWLLSLYKPTEWFTRKIITKRFTKKEITNNEHGEGTSTNILADQHQHQQEHGHEDGQCYVCYSNFSEGEKLQKLRCNLFHLWEKSKIEFFEVKKNSGDAGTETVKEKWDITVSPSAHIDELFYRHIQHVFHHECILQWTDFMKATCPFRCAMVPSKEVDYDADRIIPQE